MFFLLVAMMSASPSSPSVWFDTDPREQWTVPESKDHTPLPQTVYSPSFWASQTEFTQYCGKRGVLLSTKERVRSACSIDVVFHPCQEPSETVDIVPSTLPAYLQQEPLSPPSNPCTDPPPPSGGTRPTPLWRRTLHVVVWLLLLLWRVGRWLARATQRCLDKRYTFHTYTQGLQLEFGRTYTKTLQAYVWNRAKQRPAQKDDVHVAEQNIACLGSQIPLILWGGCGRGAATLFTALARTTADYPDFTKFLILEAPYLNIHDVFRHWCGGWWWRYCTVWSCPKQPESYVNRFPMTIPILVVGSRGDRVVPVEQVRAFVNELASLSFDVHYLELERAGHGRYGVFNPSIVDLGEEDAVLYRRVLHAAYKDLRLPYIDEMARMGREAWACAKLGHGKEAS